jgi:hypothetical protein
MKTNPAAVSAKFTKLNKAVCAARQAATDFALNNRPLSPAQTEEWRTLQAKADAAQDAVDAFYAKHGRLGTDSLKCYPPQPRPARPLRWATRPGAFGVSGGARTQAEERQGRSDE